MTRLADGDGGAKWKASSRAVVRQSCGPAKLVPFDFPSSSGYGDATGILVAKEASCLLNLLKS